MNVNRQAIGFSAGGGALVFVISMFNGMSLGDRPSIMLVLPVVVGMLSGAAVWYYYAKWHQEREEREGLFLDIIEALAAALETRDPYTHGHAARVTSLALLLGAAEGLGEADLQQLRLAAILHDIGKIGVPDRILLKPGALTDAEFAEIREHPDKGARILRLLNDPRMDEVLDGVRHHHERFDGRGYPDGLAGRSIPRLARIIAVADSYDAMTSDRPYRKGMTAGDALQHIVSGAGSQFDPQLAHLFVTTYVEYNKQHPGIVDLVYEAA